MVAAPPRKGIQALLLSVLALSSRFDGLPGMGIAAAVLVAFSTRSVESF